MHLPQHWWCAAAACHPGVCTAKNSYHAVLTTSHVLLLPLQGYLAALASAVASLETSTATLNATTLALGPLLNSTFGAAAAQAETSGAAAATTAYQVGA